MKEICLALEKIGIKSIYFLTNYACKIEFYYKENYLATVECCGKGVNTHGLENMLKGLETNYMWLGLYYKLPLRVKAIESERKHVLKDKIKERKLA